MNYLKILYLMTVTQIATSKKTAKLSDIYMYSNFITGDGDTLKKNEKRNYELRIQFNYFPKNGYNINFRSVE